MEKFLVLFAVWAMIFTSCQKDETEKTDDADIQYLTFSMQTPVGADIFNAPVPTRYVIEAYEGEALNTVPVRVEGTSGNVVIGLKQNTRYKVLFWADKGTVGMPAVTSNDYYDVDNLQKVQMNVNASHVASGEVACCQCIVFNTVDFDVNAIVQLRTAVATLKFEETSGVVSSGNRLSVTYSSVMSLNIGTGEVTGEIQSNTRSFEIVLPSGKNGVIATDYVIAPQGKEVAMDVSVQWNDQSAKMVSKVPFQQNFTTTIWGAFSGNDNLTLTFDDNTDVAKRYKVGDFYPDDEKPVGLVFWVDPTNSKKGKVFSLDQSNGITWSDAFQWVNKLETGSLTWTLPTKEEMKMIFAYYFGKKYTDISSTWGDYRSMPGYDDATVESAKDALNLKLTNHGGKSFVEDYYWTLTERDGNMWVVDFFDGYNYDDFDGNYYRTRGIYAF